MTNGCPLIHRQGAAFSKCRKKILDEKLEHQKLATVLIVDMTFFSYANHFKDLEKLNLIIRVWFKFETILQYCPSSAASKMMLDSKVVKTRKESSGFVNLNPCTSRGSSEYYTRTLIEK